jgi:hypothetical protein
MCHWYVSSRSWELPSCFHMFLVCRRHRQQGLKAVLCPCATTLLLGYAWKSLWIVAIIPDCTYVHCCHQTLDFLTSAEFTLCYEELLKIFLTGAKYCHFHSVAQKTTVLLYSSAVRISDEIRNFFLRDRVCLSRGYVQEKIPNLLK